MRFLFSIIILLHLTLGHSQLYPNVNHYDLSLKIHEDDNEIEVIEQISFLKTDADLLSFDLVNANNEGKGMVVDSVKIGAQKISFTHKNNLLTISRGGYRGNTVVIYFHGEPQDGLIISNNKFGERTFFGDNWPNRAHHWFACVDHPSDKAKISYHIFAPNTLKVIANGRFDGTVELHSGWNITHYQTETEIPTKLMVVGIANMVVDTVASNLNFPITSWVYPQNREEGFNDMKAAPEILAFFIQKIGNYPFEKLANVQSTTRYGGMENASCIFYDEHAITGKNSMISLMAHEIAHQWFGNHVSEIDWPHLWLSEGFATYLTDLYILDKYGEDAFYSRLIGERQTVLNFYQKYQLPLMDTVSTEIEFMLNPNAYQRGAWILHMLKTSIGDQAFWSALQLYQERYSYSNASTADFMNVVQEVLLREGSEFDLPLFFSQWTKTGYIPELSTNWKQKGSKVKIEINQHTAESFKFPLTLEIRFKDGTTQLIETKISDKQTILELATKNKMDCIQLDPTVQLLYKLHK